MGSGFHHFFHSENAVRQGVEVAAATMWKIGKLFLIPASGFLLSGCIAMSVTSGIVGTGVAVAGTVVGVGVSVGSTAVSATTTVVKAVVPGD